jgi:hypothetical protein
MGAGGVVSRDGQNPTKGGRNGEMGKRDKGEWIRDKRGCRLQAIGYRGKPGKKSMPFFDSQTLGLLDT